MATTDKLIEIIHDKILLSDFISKKVKLTRKGSDFIGLCPFHKEKTPSFTVSDPKGFFHCFGCSAHGDVISFVMQLDSLDFMDALEFLAKEIGVSFSDYRSFSKEENKNFKEIKGVIESSKDYFVDCLYLEEGQRVRNYLKKRNISIKAAKYFELGIATDRSNGLFNFLKNKNFKKENIIESNLIRLGSNNSLYDFFRNRLIFPIQDERGNTIGFGGRSLNNAEPKYINSSDSDLFKKRKTLYNLHRAKSFIRKHKIPLIVVEGYVDVIAMYHAGLYGAVAPLGTALSEEQLNLMWKNYNEPIICMDGDLAGYKSALRTLSVAFPILKAGKSLQFVFLPEGKDPDNLISMGKKEYLIKLINNPMSLFDFFWKSSTENILLNTPERRAGFKKSVESKISTINDKTVRSEYRNSFYSYFNKFVLNKKSYKNNSFSNHMDGDLDKYNINRINKNLNFINREKNLVHSIINNPSILNSLDEEFSILPLQNSELDSIRLAIIKIYEKNGFISQDNIEDLKKDVNFSKIYDKYFTNISWVNKSFIPPFVKANEDTESIIKIWRETASIQHNWFKKNKQKSNG